MRRGKHVHSALDRPPHRLIVLREQFIRDDELGPHGTDPRRKGRSLVRKANNIARRPEIARRKLSAFVAHEHVDAHPCTHEAGEIPQERRLAPSGRRKEEHRTEALLETVPIDRLGTALHGVRDADAERGDPAHGEHLSPLVNVRPRNADPLPFLRRHKALPQLVLHSVNGIAAGRKQCLLHLLGSRKNGILRPPDGPASSERNKCAFQVGEKRLVRPHAQFIEAAQIDMPDGLFQPWREKFQHRSIVRDEPGKYEGGIPANRMPP